MQLLTFEGRLGVKLPGGILDVQTAAHQAGVTDIPTSLPELLAGGQAAKAQLEAFAANSASGSLLDESQIRYDPCVVRPEKILCLGRNYRRHGPKLEPGQQPAPTLFAKYNNTLAACGEVIPLPPVSEQYDYEAELAVIIGQRAKNVPEADALNYVLGYCNANDLSARDLQNQTSQWMMGKTLDKFLPIGPYLVTADEIPDPQALSVRCWVNGVLGQDSNTSEMIFPVAYLITYFSRHFTLEAGDVIITGTPAHLNQGEKVWLKVGDRVTVEVQGLGQLTNIMGPNPH